MQNKAASFETKNVRVRLAAQKNSAFHRFHCIFAMQNISVYFVAFDTPNKTPYPSECRVLHIRLFTFYCSQRYFDYAVFSRNSGFGNAEFQNTVSTERTLKSKKLPFSEKNSSHHHFPNFQVFEFSSRENHQLGGGVLSKIITSWSKPDRGGGFPRNFVQFSRNLKAINYGFI